MPKEKAEIQIRKRIELQGNRQQIEKLCLDDVCMRSFTPNIRKLLQSCFNLEYLTINACQLICLDNFPLLPSLISLEVADNRLSKGLQCLRSSPLITFLSLGDNQFEAISEMAVLNSLPDLQILIVHQNPIAQLPNYRQQIFALLPSLKTIDCYDRNDHILSSDGQDSYITDKYHSLKNLDQLARLQGDDKISNQNSKDPQNQMVIKKSSSIALSRQSSQKKLMRKHRNRSNFQSEQDEPNQMINQFKRKIHKLE